MRVAVIHFSLNFLGGAEKLCLTSISALKNAGHSVTLVTVEKTDWRAVRKNFATFTMPDEELYFFSAKLSKKLFNPVLAITLFLCYLMEHAFLKMSEKYDVTLSTFGDLVYSMIDVVYVNFPLKAAGEFSQILPITNATNWRFQSKLYDLVLSILNKVPARIILANSSFTKHFVATSLKADSLVVTPPVDVDYFLQLGKNPDRKNDVVTLSGYSPKRNLEKIPEIASHSKLGHFLIIGKTDEYSSVTIQKLKTMIEQYELFGRVELLTNVQRSKLREALSEAKIYLHIMPNEHFGIAVVEAMASGCVPVVHKSGGPWLDILEQKQGEYGFAYETLEEAAERIDFLLREEELRKQTALRAMERSLKYDARVFAERIVEIVEKTYEWKKGGKEKA